MAQAAEGTATWDAEASLLCNEHHNQSATWTGHPTFTDSMHIAVKPDTEDAQLTDMREVRVHVNMLRL